MYSVTNHLGNIVVVNSHKKKDLVKDYVSSCAETNRNHYFKINK